MSVPTYNRMGLNYSDFRQPDPRIDRQRRKIEIGEGRRSVGVAKIGR